ncbi:uncharacterized protein [Bemisia tabaci]|uniref:uncharacterized protein isoform X2 n=1 Tax=Bemisia tabaci TaxID=7038 RepID=UPI0008F9CA34|nr:PREDICTED: uncharacterized protein LOC109030711 [Bemisia tabaci]
MGYLYQVLSFGLLWTIAHSEPEPLYPPLAPLANQAAYYQTHSNYHFDYGVKDYHTGDVKSQWESRDGDHVKGQYSLIEPDGSLRTVEYSADPHTGFHAIVKKSGGGNHFSSKYNLLPAPVPFKPLPIKSFYPSHLINTYDGKHSAYLNLRPKTVFRVPQVVLPTAKSLYTPSPQKFYTPTTPNFQFNDFNYIPSKGQDLAVTTLDSFRTATQKPAIVSSHPNNPGPVLFPENRDEESSTPKPEEAAVNSLQSDFLTKYFTSKLEGSDFGARSELNYYRR